MIDFKIKEYYDSIFNDDSFGKFFFFIIFSIFGPMISSILFFTFFHLSKVQFILLGIVFFVLMEISTIDIGYKSNNILDTSEIISNKCYGILSALHLIGIYLFIPLLLYKLFIYNFEVLFNLEILYGIIKTILMLLGISLLMYVNYIILKWLKKGKGKDKKIKYK